MYEKSVSIRLTCINCGAINQARAILFTESVELFEQGKHDAMLAMLCPECGENNMRFVNKTELDEIRQQTPN